MEELNSQSSFDRSIDSTTNPPEGLPDGIYTYKDVDALYKKQNGKWFKKIGDLDYAPLQSGDIDSRVNLLEESATPVPEQKVVIDSYTNIQDIDQNKPVQQYNEVFQPEKKTLLPQEKPVKQKEPQYRVVDNNGVQSWQKKKEVKVQETIDPKTGQPMGMSYVDVYEDVIDPKTVAGLNKKNNVQASTSKEQQIFTGYPGQVGTEYIVNDDNLWEVKRPGSDEFLLVSTPGAVNALNNHFKQSAEIFDDKKAAEIKDKNNYLIGFNARLNNVNKDLIGGSEEDAIQKLNTLFPEFKFEQFGIGTDNIKVSKIKNGVVVDSESVALDNFFDEDDNINAEKLKQWLRQNVNSNVDESYLNYRKSISDLENRISNTIYGEDPNISKVVSDATALDKTILTEQVRRDISGMSSALFPEETKKIKETGEQLAVDYARKIKDTYARTKDKTEAEKRAAFAEIKTDDIIINAGNNYSNQVKDSYNTFISQQKAFKQYVDDIDSKVNSGEISREDYENNYKQKIYDGSLDLIDKSKKIQDDLKAVDYFVNGSEKAIASNLMIKEMTGTFAGGLGRSIVEGALSIPTFIAGMDKKQRSEFVDSVIGVGTNSQYMQSEDRYDLTQAAFSMARSLSAMTTGRIIGTVLGPTATVGGFASLFAMSYNEMRDSLDGIKSAEISSQDKVLMSSVYALAGAALENFGLSYLVGKSVAKKSATSWILKNAFSQLGKNASKEMIEAQIMNSTKLYVSKLGLTTAGSALVEGGVESTQAGAQRLVQEAYDVMKDTDYFNNESGWEIVGDLTTNFYQGVLGAGIVETVQQSADVVSRGTNALKNKDQINLLIQSADLDGIDKALLTNLKASMLNGKMSKAQAQDIVRSFDEIKGKIKSMPEDMSVDNKSVALDLMIERDNLNKKIEGKDQFLVLKEKERINQINEQLKNLGNAVQEPSTESVLQREQEGVTETGGERGGVEQVVQGKEVTREGETKAVQEEVVIDKPVIQSNSKTEVDRVKSLSNDAEDGATFNLDGTKYEGQGLIVPVVSKNTTAEELTPEMISDFVEEHKDKIGDNETVKVGIYKFPNSNQVSIDLNILAPESAREQAIEFGKNADQESLFDLSTFENVKTGGTGLNPLQFNNEQFREISKAFKEGRVPDVFAQQPAAQIEEVTITPETSQTVTERINKETDVKRKKVFTAVQKVLSSIPNSRIILHDNTDAFVSGVAKSAKITKDQAKKQGVESNRGAYVDGDIHINLEKAGVSTVFHEAFHDLLAKKGVESGALLEMAKGLKSVISDKGLKARLDDFVSNYEQGERAEEYTTELGAIMAEAQKELSTTKFQQFKTLVNKIAKNLGLPVVFSAASTAQDAVDFMNSMSGKLGRGEQIEGVEPGDGGEVGTFNIPKIKAEKSRSVSEDPRDFIRKFVEDIDIREFNGKKFITNMYDYTNAGETDLGNGLSIYMLGGKNYVPLMMELNGKSIGDVSNLAAFNTKEQAETFIRNSELGGANLFAPHAGTLNQSWQFQQHTFAELFNLVLDNGILTPKELISVFNDSIKDNKENKSQFKQFTEKYGENIKNFDSFESDPKKIIDLLDIKNNYSPKLRKALNNAIAANKTFQKAIGVNNLNEFYKRIMDPLNEGMTGGEIMNIVEFDPTTFKIVETKPNNTDHHPSFGFTLLAKINGIYQPTELIKSVDITDSYTKYNKGGEEISRKAEEPKFEQKNVSSSAGAIPKTAEFNPKNIKAQKLAPNGKPSNLNNVQWEQVRTPAFKKWFGDWENDPANSSKVVDENGEPLVVYHGSVSTNIDEFDRLKSKKISSGLKEFGTYFTDNIKLAKAYASWAKLNKDEEINIDREINKWKEVRDKARNNKDFESAEYAISMLNESKRGKIYPVFLNLRNIKSFDAKGETNIEAWNNLEVKASYKLAKNRDAMDFLKEGKFGVEKVDGIKAENIVDAFVQDEDIKKDLLGNVYLVFDGNTSAIKSATENVGTFSAETANIKFQKQSKDDAIQDAKDKYELSVEKRGKDHKTGVTAAIADLQKSDWYRDSDDTQREESIRDIKEFFGEKIKKAPSVAKVMGKTKQTAFVSDLATAIRDQVRLQARSSRETAKDINDRRKALGESIKEVVKSYKGKITEKQLNAINRRIASVNLFNQEMVERVVDYVNKVMSNAEYAGKVNNAFAERRAIRRMMKSGNMTETVAVAREFVQIDPSMVEDIDTYLEMASQIRGTVKSSRRLGDSLSLKDITDFGEAYEYIKPTLDRQEEMMKSMKLAEYNDLVDSGIISKNMTLEEMNRIINAIRSRQDEKQKIEKEEAARDYGVYHLGLLLFNVSRINKTTGINPITGESMQLSDRVKSMIDKISKSDFNVEDLSTKQIIEMIDSLENFIQNGAFGGLEAAYETILGDQNAKSLEKKGVVARPLKLYFNKKIGQIFGTGVTSLNELFNRMFVGVGMGIEVMTKSGFSDIVLGANKARRMVKDIQDRYVNQFKNVKDFFNVDNVYERGALSFLIRNIIGTESEVKEEFNRRVDMILESYNTLKEGNTEEQKMAIKYGEIIDKLDIKSRDLKSITSKADSKNLEAVNWWINEWSNHYSDLSDVSRSVYNAILGKDINYTPDRYKPTFEGKSEDINKDLVERNSAFLINTDFTTDKKESSVMIASVRPKELPEERYVSLDFDVNNIDALTGALVDINTAGAIRRVDSFFKSKSFKKIVPSVEDRKILTTRVNRYIRRVKNKLVVPSDVFRNIDNALNTVSSVGTALGLGGVFQSIKQTVSVMASTAIQTGSNFNFYAGEDFNDWLNNTGASVANRGQESLTAVESANKKLKSFNGKIDQIGSKIKDLSQWQLRLFLSRPDVFVARSAFKSYYEQFLKSRGYDVSKINWATWDDTIKKEGIQDLNKDAIIYADTMVSRQQNISDERLTGELLASEDSARKLIRKVLLPFASFSINQRSRLVADINALVVNYNNISPEDRAIALKSIAGTAAEQGVFQMINFGIGMALYSVAQSITGHDDDDEEWKKRKINATKYPLKSLLADMVSPNPLADDAVIFGADELLAMFGSPSESEIKQAIKDEEKTREMLGKDPMTDSQINKFREQYIKDNTYQLAYNFSNSEEGKYGMFSIVADQYQKLAENSEMANNGTFTDDYMGTKTTKYLTDKDKNLAKAIFYGLEVPYTTGAGVKEMGQIANKAYSIIKKRGLTEKQYETYKEFKKEFKREPQEWEVKMIKSTKSQDNLIDEVYFIQEQGGLSPKQGVEYLKVFNKMGPLVPEDYRLIVDGKSADYVLKKALK
jgi:hypothetical protein